MGVPGRLYIELLGGFKLQYNGKLVTTIDTPRLRQLLAYLLLYRNTQISRQYLAFKFWPQSTEKQALTNLRNLLYQIKNTLPEANRFLIINTKNIQWNTHTDYKSDISEFEDAVSHADSSDDIEHKINFLEKAIELYNGPLLPECYEEWIDKHRQRFQQLYKKSLEELVKLQEGRSHLKEAVQYTKKLIQHNSLNESAWRKLMKLHALNNNRAEALQTYQNCLESLREEFNIEPAPETKQMHRQLLDSCGAENGFQSEKGNTKKDEIKLGVDEAKRTKTTQTNLKKDFPKRYKMHSGTFTNQFKSGKWENIFPDWMPAISTRTVTSASFAIIVLVVLTLIIWQNPSVINTNEVQTGAVSEGTQLLITAFENHTDQDDLGLSIRKLVVSDLAQSAQLNIVGDAEVQDAYRRMILPDTSTFTLDVGLEIGVRDGYPVIISGEVSSIGSSYQVSVLIIETVTRKTLTHLRETAATEDDIIKAVQQLSRRLREHLAKSLSSIRQISPLPKVTTSSLEALKSYSQAREYFGRGEYRKCITLAEQAVELDSEFTNAYWFLAAAHNNIGSHEKATHYRDLADSLANRLSKPQRIVDMAEKFFDSDNLDSAGYYYELLQELDPDRSTFPLGEVYLRMGQLEKALQMYRLNLKKSQRIVPHIELIRIARKLGDEQLADSVLVLMKERFPENVNVYSNEVANALRFRHLGRADSLATKMASHSDRKIRAWGEFHKLFLAAMHGKMKRTLAEADSLSMEALRYVGPAGTSAYLRMSVAAALAAKASDRALPALRAAEPHLWDRNTSWGVADLEVLASGYALAGKIEESERVLIRIDSLREANNIRSTYGPKVRAVIALIKEQPKEAINQLRAFRSQRFGKFDPLNMWIWAKAHFEAGMPDEAIEAYNNILYSARLGMWYWSFYRGPLWPLAHEQLGYTYLATGETAKAREHLSTFVDLWDEADADLQPRVEAARDTLAQL